MGYKQGPLHAASYRSPRRAPPSGTSRGREPHGSGACPGGPGSPESSSPEQASKPPAPRPPAQMSFSAPVTQGEECCSRPSPRLHPRQGPRTQPTCLYRKDWLSNSRLQNRNRLGTQVPMRSGPQGSLDPPVWPPRVPPQGPPPTPRQPLVNETGGRETKARGLLLVSGDSSASGVLAAGGGLGLGGCEGGGAASFSPRDSSPGAWALQQELEAWKLAVQSPSSLQCWAQVGRLWKSVAAVWPEAPGPVLGAVEPTPCQPGPERTTGLVLLPQWSLFTDRRDPSTRQ